MHWHRASAYPAAVHGKSIIKDCISFWIFVIQFSLASVCMHSRSQYLTELSGAILISGTPTTIDTSDVCSRARDRNENVACSSGLWEHLDSCRLGQAKDTKMATNSFRHRPILTCGKGRAHLHILFRTRYHDVVGHTHFWNRNRFIVWDYIELWTLRGLRIVTAIPQFHPNI